MSLHALYARRYSKKKSTEFGRHDKELDGIGSRSTMSEVGTIISFIVETAQAILARAGVSSYGVVDEGTCFVAWETRAL